MATEIKTYDNIYLETEEGLIATDRQKLFVPMSGVQEDGSLATASFGNNLVDKELGITFIVDSCVCEQFEKLKIDFSSGMPKLFLKEGEEIIDNKSQEEIDIEALRQELAIKEAELNKKINKM